MKTKPTASISQRIKKETAELHQRAESVSFFSELLQLKAEKQTYISYLRILAIIHATLEKEVSNSDHVVLKTLWQEKMRRLPLLEEDIEILITSKKADSLNWTEVYAEPDTPISIALRLALRIRVLSMENPFQLLGFLYVLEGSTNGGIRMAPRVTEAFGLSGNAGVRYLMNYGEEQSREWQNFKQRLEEAVISEDDVTAILAGAKEMFQNLIAVFEALSVPTKEKVVHASILNPEAGSHVVPQAGLELEASFIVAKKCLQALPYVFMRYGERGERFTKSDGAWIITLADFSDRVVFNQIEWLGRLLSVLGIPRFTLELNLREAAKELSTLRPTSKDKYAVLVRAADLLEQNRKDIIPLKRQEELQQRFLAALNPAELETYRNIDNILISSVADEKMDGLGALGKTLEWIQEKSNWPKNVIRAALDLVKDLQSTL